jgi:FKBP-type peptidyl-prolyl cis-trans isomerase
MRVGGKRMLEVPAELGYGEKGVKDRAKPRWVIPPNAALYFRVELVAVGELGFFEGSVRWLTGQ